MRKISTAALLLSIACPDLMAFSSDIPVGPDPNAATVKSTPEVPDYGAVPVEILLKNAIKNPDGSLTIKAGRQTPQANAMNHTYCEIIGGTDITNESDRTIEGGTLYQVVCQGPAGHYPPSIATANFRLGTQLAVHSMSGEAPSLQSAAKDERGMYLNPFSKK